jgi:hypothetical protein
MENNNPYEYEKPLSAKSPKRALALGALTVVFAASAIGAAALGISSPISKIEAKQNPASNQYSQSEVANQPLVVVPFESVEPRETSGTVSLVVPSKTESQEDSIQPRDDDNHEATSSRHENKSENRESDYEQDDD